MSVEYKPYVGPRPFEQEHESIFFGRERETSEIISLIVSHPVTLVYSQSGAGKTSLLNAKLVPLLERKGFQVLPRARMRDPIPPDVMPRNVYVFNTLAGWAGGTDTQRLAQTSLADFLKGLKHNVSREEGEEEWSLPRIAIWDQFEEFFTFHQDRWGDREKFFKQLNQALDADPLLRVVFLMREDYIAELDPYVSILPEKLKTRFRLERLRHAAALSAVKEPLRHTELRFAEGVAEQLVTNLMEIPSKASAHGVRAVAEFVEPVQLQVVCQNLWGKLRGRAGGADGVITADDLREFGDVNKALLTFYEDILRKVMANERIRATGLTEGALRRWFEHVLITPAGTRGMVYRGAEDTGGIPNEVVELLDAEHIVRPELRGGEPWYELSHDRLIQPVRESNKQWLLKHSSAEEKRQELQNRFMAWQRSGKGDDLLLNEGELAQAENWLRTPGAAEVGYSDAVFALIQSSRVAVAAAAHAREMEHQRALTRLEEERAEAERQQAEERAQRIEAERRSADERAAAANLLAEQEARTASRLRWLTTAVSVLSVLAFATAFYAWTARASAQASARVATAERLKAEELAQTLSVSLESETAAKQEATRLAEVEQKQRRQVEEAAKEVRQAVESEKRAKEQALKREREAIARKQQADNRFIAADKKYQDAQRESDQARQKLADALVRELATRAESEAVSQQLKDAQEKNEAAVTRLVALNASYAESQRTIEKQEKDYENVLAELARLQSGTGTPTDAEAVFIRALALESSGDATGAEQSYNEARSLYAKKGDRQSEARALAKIGALRLAAKDHAAARVAFEASRKLDDKPQIVRRIGDTYFSLLRPAGPDKPVDREAARQALDHYALALKGYKEAKDRDGEAATLDSIGDTHLELEDYDLALAQYTAAESAYDESNNNEGEAHMLFMMGYAHQLKGNKLKTANDSKSALKEYEAALKNYSDSLDKREELGNVAGQVAALTNIGEVYRSLGQPEKAAEYFQRARELQERKQNTQEQLRPSQQRKQ